MNETHEATPTGDGVTSEAVAAPTEATAPVAGTDAAGDGHGHGERPRDRRGRHDGHRGDGDPAVRPRRRTADAGRTGYSPVTPPSSRSSRPCLAAGPASPPGRRPDGRVPPRPSREDGRRRSPLRAGGRRVLRACRAAGPAAEDPTAYRLDTERIGMAAPGCRLDAPSKWVGPARTGMDPARTATVPVAQAPLDGRPGGPGPGGPPRRRGRRRLRRAQPEPNPRGRPDDPAYGDIPLRRSGRHHNHNIGQFDIERRLVVASASGSPQNTSSIAAQVSPGLVDINTTLKAENEEAAGTGMVLTSNGEVLTNNHVIEGATTISVTDIGNGKTYWASVVGYDRTEDMAVIQLKNASGLKTVPRQLLDVASGQGVVGIGNAGGVGGTPSVAGGSVTALGQSITASDSGDGTSERLTDLIETTATSSPATRAARWSPPRARSSGWTPPPRGPAAGSPFQPRQVGQRPARGSPSRSTRPPHWPRRLRPATPRQPSTSARPRSSASRCRAQARRRRASVVSA